ncbi:aminotransferase class IV [Oerskovia sp. M15]
MTASHRSSVPPARARAPADHSDRRLRAHGLGAGAGEQTIIVAAGPASPGPTSRSVRSPWVRNERSAVAGLKTTSYAENVVALADAVARGGDEAILANTVGELCEGTGANVLVEVGGELLTPRCRRGVSRGSPASCSWSGPRRTGFRSGSPRRVSSRSWSSTGSWPRARRRSVHGCASRARGERAQHPARRLARRRRCPRRELCSQRASCSTAVGGSGWTPERVPNGHDD